MDTFNLGTVDEVAYDRLCDFLGQAENLPVLIRINSIGGNHLDSLAIYSLLREYKGKVTTAVYGTCQSAAVIVFAAGDRRICTEESWFMVHEDTANTKGTVSSLHAELTAAVQQEKQWADIMEKRTTTASEGWAQMSKETTYFPAKLAIITGLAHALIKEKEKND